MSNQIVRALLSVSNKAGLDALGRFLTERHIEMLSTGGTAQFFNDRGLPVTQVSRYTRFPEIMDGRVKTFHPKVLGGILGRRGKDEPLLRKHRMKWIDLVVVNLYPFEDTIAKPHCTLEDAIENIDIGGPSMVRAAGKNHEWVTVVVDPDDYAIVIAEMQANGGATTLETRRKLAAKAFRLTANYDDAIATYLEGQS